ncbi:MAG: hypothetical protein AAF721_11725 [Myxococcota bacterium]
MSETSPGWSTLKVFSFALLLTFAVMFLGNALFNELLGWGVATWVFSCVSGALMFPFVVNWDVFRRIVRRPAEDSPE